ncbi:hypothetical protein [Chromobacterium violaceum]|uniref:hypothetical protein n=1 Tax=Chromobacterium violaceum TaxID=536 RepID=UPI00159578CD|nr:hypothetical protein [Chromobacterium violaceum]
MAKPIMITVRVRMRWWLPLYVAGVDFMSTVTGMEPDDEQVRKWLKRGMHAELVKD